MRARVTRAYLADSPLVQIAEALAVLRADAERVEREARGEPEPARWQPIGRFGRRT